MDEGGTHALHAVDPGGDVEPGGHGSQFSGEAPPLLGLKVSAGHSSQSLSATPPGCGKKVPAGHASHSAAPGASE